MIRKFSVTHTNSVSTASRQQSLEDSARRSITNSAATTEETGSACSRQVVSPISHIDSVDSAASAVDQPKAPKLYAQSLESTENSDYPTSAPLVKSDALLYPLGSEDYETSTDEGLSMSEEEDVQSMDQSELTRIINDLDIDHKLSSAAQRGDTERVKELLSSGAQVITDETGSTAIHIAAQNGFAEVVRLLLEHGTDVDIPDSCGYTALHKAAGNGHLDVEELLINEGCDIDTQDDLYGNTPLHEAAWHGFSKSVDLLLKNKSNAFITNRAGCTPLHLAAQNGHNQSGRTLLYEGCSPDVKNNYGDTPLHTATRYGHAGIARILLSAKCSVSEQNKNGDSSLHIAAAFKRRKIAKLLTEARINSHILNKQGETAVDIARRKGHPELIEIIHGGSEGVRHSHHQAVHQLHPPDCVASTKASRGRSKQDGMLHQQLASGSRPEEQKEQKKSAHNAFVSWLRKKFTKKPNKKKSGQEHMAEDDDNSGLYSQYIKKPGFAYYRDLAGNIRQGPCGYVPAACQNDLPPNIKEQPDMSGIHVQRMRSNEPQVPMHMMRREHSRTLKERREINKQLAQVENDLQELRGDLQTWLEAQAGDGIEYIKHSEDPFAYAIGSRQTRFGDDFDHERMAKYDVTEQYPPPPRLFRSRSDETLSHSEYSYHGRAYKSKEAAMEELKTLKHHEELRARRKAIRSGVEGEQNAPPRQSVRREFSGSRYQLHPRESASKSNLAKLWQSQENMTRSVHVERTSARKQPESTYPGEKEAQLVMSYPSGSRQLFPSTERTQQRTAPVGGYSTPPPEHVMPSNSADVTNQPVRQPATYQLISAALKPAATSQSHQISGIASRPQPARRPSVGTKPLSSTPSQPNKSTAAEQSETNCRNPQLREPEKYPSAQRSTSNEQNRVSGSGAPVPCARRHLPTYEEARLSKPAASSQYGGRLSAQRLNLRTTTANTEASPAVKPVKVDGLAVTTGESCCSSSNPDSGYGGQNYDFYSSHPSPQADGNNTQNGEYESGWYSRRLQDAARKISIYSSFRPQRTMTTDV